MYISRDWQQVVLPYRDDVRALFPHARNFTWNGHNMLAVKHGTEETRMLRNLSLEVPAPIVDHYKWTGWKKPFLVQIKTCALMTTTPRCYVLNRMGTGKTKAALWSFDWLRSQGDAKKMLVVCPLSTMNFTWATECFETVPHLKVVLVQGPAAKRRERIMDQEGDIFIVNHDGVAVVMDEILRRPDIDCVCVDEAAVFRNARTMRSKAMRIVSKHRRWVWGMTGSPTPNEPTDAFGLLHLVTPNRAPSSFRQFRYDTMLQVNQFRWVPRADAANIVADFLQPAVCFDLDDVVELPELVEQEIQVAISVKQRTAYEDMARSAIAMFKDGSVTAKNGAIAFNKLLQMSMGYVYKEGGKENYEDLEPHMRLETVKDVIEGSMRKVIVFAPYLHAVREISKFLTHHKIKHFTVTGETPHHERDNIFTQFQHGQGREPIIAHPGTMSHGLTLTSADTILWYSPISSLEIFEQANARITRVGQTHKQQILMMSGTLTERKVYDRLRARRAIQDDILELLAEALEA